MGKLHEIQNLASINTDLLAGGPLILLSIPHGCSCQRLRQVVWRKAENTDCLALCRSLGHPRPDGMTAAADAPAPPHPRPRLGQGRAGCVHPGFADEGMETRRP